MFLETGFPPDPRVENEAMSLIKEGHSVHLFSLSHKKPNVSVEIINGINVYRFPISLLTYKLSALVYTIPFYRWLITPFVKRFLDQVKPEVLHIHDMILAETVIKVNNNSRPCILDLHENKPAIMEFYHHINVFPGKYLISLKSWNLKQNELINKADYTITVTEEAIDNYTDRMKISRNRFVAVPNTVNLAEFLRYPFDNGITERFKGSFNILYLGDTGLRRGLFTAIEAVFQLKKDIPAVKLIIVGRSSADVILIKRASELGVLESVAFEGWQDVSLFPSYIKASDICISPIHRNLHHDTTYANKIFQYMAIGRAMVVSDCPPQAKIIEESEIGLVHGSEDVSHFVSCIEELYKNDSLRLDMGQRAVIACKESWNWETTGRDLVALYDKL